MHFYGRISSVATVLFLLMIPLSICIRFNAFPTFTEVFKGLMKVIPIFWTTAILEIITFSPMLGTGATYLSFVTGNITNLKAPAALNALELVGADVKTEEGEIVSTIAIAVSSIVTTLIIVLGVVLITPLTPVLNSPALAPAFDQILPALFGGLGVVYISRNWKIAIAPVLLMLVLFIAIPALGSVVSIMVPVGVLFSLAVSRILYKKGVL